MLRPSTLGWEIATPLPFRSALRRAGDHRFRVAAAYGHLMHGLHIDDRLNENRFISMY